MIIVAIRTDTAKAEVGLYKTNKKLAYKKWQADRQLAETIHSTIRLLLKTNKFTWTDIKGVIVFEGPGSFTGLRIGLTVANALAYSLNVPIIAASGESWIKDGIGKLNSGENHKIVLPDYGAPAHVTAPKK